MVAVTESYHVPLLVGQYSPRPPNSKVYGANMGPTRGRQDPGGPHVGPMNLAIWVQSFASEMITHNFQWFDQA